MSDLTVPQLSQGTATGRWAKVGPYYAMFPVDFAFHVVSAYSKVGDAVLDPFAGRASSTYAAAILGRQSLGIEINPVGWLYGKVKLRPAGQEAVTRRVENIRFGANSISQQALNAMPEFFHCCYTPTVLRYLMAARETLQWRTSKIDATVMAIILVHLHGKIENSLSNQMRQGKAMSPQYSIQWWENNNSAPPDIDPIEFLKKRLQWRYAKGIPSLEQGNVICGDSTLVLRRPKRHRMPDGFNLLFTSPPYYAITDYHYDQWIRLWMLGGSGHPEHQGGVSTGRFESKPAYKSLLTAVFSSCVPLMRERSVAYVRTDARKFTADTTIDVMREAFPDKVMSIKERPFLRKTQTALYGDKSEKPGELDIIMMPK